jgi:2-dehydro-3-deoxyphosphooctonate aldolase (KDO 8-P synthase)
MAATPQSSIFGFRNDANSRLFVVAGPCVIESEETCLEIGKRLAALSERHSVDIVFKASYDKANRLSLSSFRGPGKTEGLRILERVKQATGLPVLTDVHVPTDAAEVAEVADVIQIPAFLCRQTDLITAAAQTGRIVNLKKGQFMAPQDMRFALEKAGERTWVTERGTFFGYNRIVVDFAAIGILRSFGRPLVFDATHSVQHPGGGEGRSSGDRSLAIPLARAALGAGFDALFFEVHPQPERALCDGPNSLVLDDFERELPRLIELHRAVAEWAKP